MIPIRYSLRSMMVAASLVPPFLAACTGHLGEAPQIVATRIVAFFVFMAVSGLVFFFVAVLSLALCAGVAILVASPIILWELGNGSSGQRGPDSPNRQHRKWRQGAATPHRLEHGANWPTY